MEAATFNKSLEDLMATFSMRMDSFEGKLQQNRPSSSIDALAAEYATFKSFVLASLRTLQDQIQYLAQELDRQEMRKRRKILLVHGLPEASNEATVEVLVKAFTAKLTQPISLDDINRCHRMGRPGNPDKPRPILCKFQNVEVRDKIWSMKSGFKGSGTTISEFLTKPRHNIFMSARQRFGISKCWTRQGYVYVLGSDGSRNRVSCQDDFENIPVDVAKPTAGKATASSKEVCVPTKTKRAAAKK